MKFSGGGRSRCPLRILAGAVALAVLAVAALGAGEAGATLTVRSGFQSQVALSSLEQPTNFRFAPDGRVFVAQKNGEIKVFPAGSGPSATPQTFADLRKPVYDFHDRGLLGLALDPKFDEGRPYVYALYTFDHELGKPFTSAYYPRWGTAPNYEGEKCDDPLNGCVVSGRLVKLTAEGNHAAPSAAAPAEQVLIEDWCQQYPSHSVGDLQFGPEGALFLGGGDGAAYENVTDFGQEHGNPCGDPPEEGGSLRSQSVLRPNGQVTLDGTLLRVDPDTGKGWPGNPFAGDPNENKQRIVAFGFRNPFRFTIDQATDNVYVGNVGNVNWEEIDRFPIGATSAYNSGWPCYEGSEINLAFQTYDLAACNRLYEATGSTSAPFFKYNHKAPVSPGDNCPSEFGSAISGSAFYEGAGDPADYPDEYDHAFFFADSARQCIWVMPADGGEPDPSRVSLFLSESGEYLYPGVDLEQGPGGDIYYAALGTGTINRIFYDPGAPKAVLEADKEYGSVNPAGLKVKFDASGSVLAEGQAEYGWDLDGDGQFDDGTGATEEHTYTDGTKNVEVAVRVKDSVNHKAGVARKTIYPGDSPPQVTIGNPSPSLTWGVGQLLHFSGSAKADGGSGSALPAANLAWESRLAHCPFGAGHCHEHPLQAIRGIAGGDLVAPNHEYPSHVNFVLTATDGRGLSAKASVEVAARPVTLDVESSPPGIPIIVGTDPDPITAPFDYLAIEGSPTTIAAPSSAGVGGVTYAFKSWSDGGPRVRTVPATSSATYLAEYTATAGPPNGGGQNPGGSGGTGGGGSGSGSSSTGPPKISGRPAKRTSSRVAKFAFAAAGAPRFQCRIDRGRFAFCRSPRSYRHLKPGKHTFRVRAADSSGKPLSSAAVYGWSVVSG